jgi:hypothetical protein
MGCGLFGWPGPVCVGWFWFPVTSHAGRESFVLSLRPPVATTSEPKLYRVEVMPALLEATAHLDASEHRIGHPTGNGRHEWR